MSASRVDVRLTMIAGKPSVAEEGLRRAFEATRVPWSPALLDGSPRIVARWIADRVSSMRLREPGFEIQ
jgi:hypothetical protein